MLQTDCEEEQVKVFDGNDALYLFLINSNPKGYILTSSRSLYPLHTVIHHASCPLIKEIRGNAKPGGFTERGYIKVYADNILSLKIWLRKKRVDGISRECSFCFK